MTENLMKELLKLSYENGTLGCLIMWRSPYIPADVHILNQITTSIKRNVTTGTVGSTDEWKVNQNSENTVSPYFPDWRGMWTEDALRKLTGYRMNLRVVHISNTSVGKQNEYELVTATAATRTQEIIQFETKFRRK